MSTRSVGYLRGMHINWGVPLRGLQFGVNPRGLFFAHQILSLICSYFYQNHIKSEIQVCNLKKNFLHYGIVTGIN